MTDVLNRTFTQIEQDRIDAERYRWLRSEHVNTDPIFYPFWNVFGTKLCREEKMDAAIDAEMREHPLEIESLR